MSGNRTPAEIAREWVEKAENDMKNAVHTLKLGKGCPTDTACFHAQQCVEKYLKALLASTGIAFPKTHEIGRLVSLLPEKVSLSLAPAQQEKFTEYATVSRYPGNYEPITLEEAREAVRIARRVRKEIRQFLPKAALRLRAI